jgi:hypothetical protein
MYTTTVAQDLNQSFLNKCQDVETRLDDVEEPSYRRAQQNIISDINELDRTINTYNSLHAESLSISHKVEAAKESYKKFLEKHPESTVVTNLRRDFELLYTSIRKKSTITQDFKSKKLKDGEDAFLSALAGHINPEIEEIKQQLYTAYYQASYDSRSLIIEMKKLNDSSLWLKAVIPEKISALSCYTIRIPAHRNRVRFFEDEREVSSTKFVMISEDQETCDLLFTSPK